jgi:hypothetical protein
MKLFLIATTFAICLVGIMVHTSHGFQDQDNDHDHDQLLTQQTKDIPGRNTRFLKGGSNGHSYHHHCCWKDWCSAAGEWLEDCTANTPLKCQCDEEGSGKWKACYEAPCCNHGEDDEDED